MRLTPQFESTLRRFVLGDLEEGLRTELEELLITDTEAFEALGVIEDELIEEYLEGTGSAADRQATERHFLASPERSRRVRFARALKDRASRFALLQAAGRSGPEVVVPAAALVQSAARSAPRLFGDAGWRQLAIGLAATLVVSLTGNVWLASRAKERVARPEAATLTMPKPQPPLAPSPAAMGVDTFILSPGLLRSEGSLPRVTAPADALAVRLLLELRGDAYPSYRAVLMDEEGDEVWTASKLRAEVKEGQSAIVLMLPSALLPRGDYRVDVRGIRKGAEPEVVGTYAFRVSHQ